jgi:hypothetical protein
VTNQLAAKIPAGGTYIAGSCQRTPSSNLKYVSTFTTAQESLNSLQALNDPNPLINMNQILVSASDKLFGKVNYLISGILSLQDSSDGVTKQSTSLIDLVSKHNQGASYDINSLDYSSALSDISNFVASFANTNYTVPGGLAASEAITAVGLRRGNTTIPVIIGDITQDSSEVSVNGADLVFKPGTIQVGDQIIVTIQ